MYLVRYFAYLKTNNQHHSLENENRTTIIDVRDGCPVNFNYESYNTVNYAAIIGKITNTVSAKAKNTIPTNELPMLFSFTLNRSIPID